MTADIPRLVWKSRSGSMRVVVTDHGPDRFLMTAADLPSGHYYCLEVRELADAMGAERWRMVDTTSEPGYWREAFHQLAQDVGLFSSSGDVSDQVRQLLRSTEASA